MAKKISLREAKESNIRYTGLSEEQQRERLGYDPMPAADGSEKPEDKKKEPEKGWTPDWQQRMAMDMTVQEAKGAAENTTRSFKDWTAARMERAKKPLSEGRTIGGGVRYNPGTGKLEETYIDAYGGRTFDKMEADEASRRWRLEHPSVDMTVGGQLRAAEEKRRELEEKLRRRGAELDAESRRKPQRLLDRLMMAGNDMARGGTGSMTMNSRTAGGRYIDDEYIQLEEALRQTDELIGRLERQRDREAGEDVGFWRTTFDTMPALAYKADPFAEARASNARLTAAAGGGDTEREQEAANALFEQTFLNQQAGGMYDRQDNWRARAGYMFVDMLPFMADIASASPLTGGIRGGAKLAVHMSTRALGRETLEAMAKQGFKTYVKNNGLRGLGQETGNFLIKATGATLDDLAKGAAIAGTVQLGKTAGDITDRKLGDVVADADGRLHFEDEASWNYAIWQGAANSVVENMSEMAGVHFGHLLAPVKKAMAEGMTRVFGAGRLGKVFASATSGTYGKMLDTTRRYLERAGVSDLVEEAGEEYYGQLWRTMLGLDDAYTTDEQGRRVNLLADAQFHADIWGGIALSMGVLKAGSHGVAAVGYLDARHRLKKSEAKASSLLGSQTWEGLRAAIDNTSNGDMGSLVAGIMADGEMTAQEKEAVMEYVGRSMEFRGYNLGTMAENRGKEDDGIAEDANRAYMNGYNAHSAEEMQDAVNMLLRMQGEMAVIFGLESGADVPDLVGDDPLAFVEEMRRSGNLTAGSTVLDYVNARMVYEGMMQRVRDDIDSRVAASDAAVDGRVNRTTGMVEGAVLKAQDADGRERRVYVTNGRVAMLPDGGGVDTEHSDRSIVVRDAATGEVEMIAPEAIFRLEEPIDPETEKRVAAEAIRQGMAAEAAAKMDGKVAFNEGDTYRLTYPDGRQEELTVVENGGSTDAGEGRVWVSPDGGSPALAMSREEIQAGVDATNRGRVDRFVEERRSSEGSDAASGEKDYALNEELTLRDGSGGTFGAVVVVDADYNDGTVLVQVETPDGPRVVPYSREELNAMRAEEAPAAGETEAPGAGEQAGAWVNEEAVGRATARDLVERDPTYNYDYYEGRPEEVRREIGLRAAATAEYVAGVLTERGFLSRMGYTDAWLNGEASEEEVAARALAESERWMPFVSVAQEQEPAADGAGMGQENISENGNNGLQNIPAQEDTQKEMQNGKILHLHERLSPGSERYLTETPTSGRPDLVPSSDNNVKVTVPVDGSGVSTGKVTENAGEVQTRGAVIPRDKKGRVLYAQVPVEVTVADLYDGSLTDGEVRAFIAANIREARRRYEQKQERAPKMGTDKERYLAAKAKWQTDVSAAKGELDYWRSVEDYVEKQTHTTAEEVEAVGRELSGAAAREEYGRLHHGSAPTEAHDVAGRFLQGKRVTPESFRRETGYGTGEQRRFVGLIASAENGGKSIERLSEELVTLDEEEYGGGLFHGDTQAARGALLEALGRAGTRRELAADEGAGADEYAAAREKERDAFYMEAYGMPYAEYLAYEEQVMPSIWERYGNFDTDVFYSAYAEEIENELNRHEHEERNDARGEEPGADGGAALLPRERTDNAGGDWAGTEPAGEVSAGVPGAAAQGAVGEAAHERGGQGDTGSLGGREHGNSSQEAVSEINLSKEVDENGYPFVLAPNGKTTFGEIRENSGLVPAPIKLSEGYQDENGKGYGLVHIDANHGEQIRKAGFASVEDFVSYVATNYDEDNIRVGKRRYNGSPTFLIQVTDTHDNTLFIEMSKDGSYWNVNSAGIFRKGYSNKKETVVKTEPQQPNNAVSTGSSLSENEEGGITSSEPNGEPTVSSGKDTDKSAAVQTIGEKVAKAEAETNTEPTEAQKEAGNYKKGHVRIGQFDITVENPKGSVRRGVDGSGKAWEQTMQNTYGYIRGTEGVDGDHIDVFLGDDIDGWNGRRVYIVDQYNEDGTFDEHKVMLGFNDEAAAQDAYLSNYEKGWEEKRKLVLSSANLKDFEKWISSSHRKTKPFAEYKSVKKGDVGDGAGSLAAEAREAFSGMLSASEHEVEIIDGEVSETDNTLYAPVRVDGKATHLSLYQTEPVHSSGEPVRGVSFYREGMTYQEASDLSEAYNRHAGKEVCRDGADELAVNFESIDEAVRFEQWLAEREDGDVLYRNGEDEKHDGDPEEVNRRFNEELHRYQEGEMDRNEMFHLGNPNGVMRMFLPDLPIVMRQRIIRKGSEKKHNVSLSAITDMPTMISDPIFVFQRDANTIGILTDMTDNDGKNVCVAIELGKTIQDGKEYLEVNDIRSFHGREVKYIVEPIVYNNTLRYANKEKGLAWLSSASQPVQQEIDKQDLVSAANIVENFENPGVLDENMGLGDGISINEEEANDLFRVVDDASEIERLNNEPTIKVYRAMSLVDGKLYPPMSKKIGTGSNRVSQAPSEFGQWEVSDERPELVEKDGKNKNHIYIVKDNGKGLWVAYNPYFHTSRNPLNDQFAEAYQRPNLVTVEVEVPASELTSGYQAEGAKDPVGETKWNAGPVNRQLSSDKKRKVILSRWMRPVRIVPESEVAQRIAELIEGENVAIPDNTVTPSLLEELKKLGVKIVDGINKSRKKAATVLRGGNGRLSDEDLSTANDPVSKLVGKSGRTARQRRAFAERERGRMVERVRALAERLHLDNVEIVTDASTLQGARAKAKGFYSRSTGRITIVVPNHVDTFDVEQTLLHEAVAHYGLRQLFGEHFDTFLDNVFENADMEVRRGIIELSKKHGWDFRTATEEYLASLAENTNFENTNAGWWQKIKELFLRMLHKIGFENFSGVTLSDNELRYILWRSYENLAEPGRYRSIFGEAADVAKQAELKVGNYAPADAGIGQVAEAANTAKAERIRKLRDSKPVEITGEEIEPSDDLKQYKKNALEYGKSLRANYQNKDTGVTIQLGKTGVKEVLNHDYKNVEQLQSIAAIPQIIENSIYIDSQKNTDPEKNEDVSMYHYYVCGLKIGDTDYTVRAVIAEQPNGNRYYDHKLTQIEKGRLLDSLSGITTPGFNQETSPVSDVKDTKLLSILQENGEGNNRNEDDVLFREGAPEEHERVLARERYEQRVKRGMYQMQEALQDSMLGLREAMDAILRGEGKKKVNIEDVDGFENAYLGENRLSSVNKAEADAFAHLLFKPLLDEVAKLAPNEAARSRLTDYMMAKHGLERNEVMAHREAGKQAYEEFKAELRKAEHAVDKNPLDQDAIDALDDVKQRMHDREEELYYENRSRDYAGLTALTGTDNVTDAEAEAMMMVDEYEAAHDTAALWERTKGVSDAILSKLYETGMMSKDTYESVRSMYDYYIPLRGFDEKTSEEAYAYLNSKNSAFNAPIKTAKGRKSKADDPFAYLQSMAESAIMQGNRNSLVKQRFLNFVLNHPSDLASVSDLWVKYDEVSDEWQPVFPEDISEGDSAEEVERKMLAFEQRMKQLAEAEPDVYKHGKDAVNIPYRVVTSRDLHQHQVVVKRGGRDYVITINGNPRAAQALNGQTNPDNDMSGAIGAILRAGERINRELSALYTTRNPDFVVSNFIRDMLYSNSMAWVKESPNYALRYHRNFARVNPARMKVLLAKYRNGTLDMNDGTERMFYQFMMNGGETGYANIRDIEKHKNDIRRELRKANGRIPIRKAWDLLTQRLDELNRGVENCARFAAFLTSREMGRTIDRSIYDAKEISVNFNKKGSGAKFMGANGQTALGNAGAFVSGLGRSGFVFWNAAIQGTANFGRQAKRHPGKALTGLAVMFLLGAVVASLGYGDDDEDDENSYWNLPEYVRRSNLLFRAGDQWVSIPLPVEYRAVYGLGELMTSTLSGKEHFTDGELAGKIAGQVSQLLPLDFLEGGGGLKALIPSSIKPFAEAYGYEKSWTGLPLYKDTPYNKDMPEWTKAYKSANRYLVDMSEALGEASGGDKYTKGAIDINPAKVEYVLTGYFGGVANTIDRLTKMGETMVGQREYDPKSFLVLNRVLKNGDERTEYKAVNNEYFRLKEEHDRTGKRLRNYERDTNEGIFDFAEKIDFLYNSPEYRRYEIFEDYRRDIDALYDMLKEANEYGDEEEAKDIEAQLNEEKKEMIKEMNETR